jgi:hypothetical protein
MILHSVHSTSVISLKILVSELVSINLKAFKTNLRLTFSLFFCFYLHLQSFGQITIAEDFDYGASAGNLAGQNGGSGFATAWAGGTGGYTPTGLSFGAMSSPGGAHNSTGFSRQITTGFAASGPVSGSFLFQMTSPTSSVQMLGLGVIGSWNNQNHYIGLMPANDGQAGKPALGIRGTGISAMTGGASLTQGTTYMYAFSYDNGSTSAWILSLSQYINFFNGTTLDQTAMNAAPIGAGPTDITGKVTIATSASNLATMNNIYTYWFGGGSMTIDRIRMSGTAALMDLEPALAGAALDFDGVNDYVNVGDVNALDDIAQFTMEAWVYKTASSVFTPIIAKTDPSFNFATQLAGFNNSFICRVSNNGDAFGMTPSGSFPLNTWTHVAAVFDGTATGNANRLKIYVNGVAQPLSFSGNPIPPLTSSTTENVEIGRIAVDYFPGKMDEVRIWTTARTCDQIFQLRNCELMGNESGLLAYYKFNQGVANENNSGVTILTDAAGGDQNGTLSGFALNGATSNWVAPGGVTSGTNCAPVTSPEINVQGNSTSIADGNATPSFVDHTDFAYVANGYNIVRTFTIQNTGTGAMNVTGITAVGGDAGMFSIGALSPASPIPGGGSATFTVTYTPTGTGLKSTTLHIASNDCDEADYDFVVRGNTGPNIILDFGGIPNGVIGNYYNGGAGPNYGITFNPGIANNNGLSESSNPLVNFPAGFTTSFSVYGNVLIGFQVRVFDGLDGTGTQLGMAEYVGGPGAVVTVNFCGTGRSVSVARYSQPNAGYDDLTFGPAPVPVPEIDVQGGSPLVTINDGDITPSTTDHTDFSNVAVNGSVSRTFTIFNTGNAALTISSITSNNTRFVVSGAPTSVAANSSDTFIVTFSPTALGVQNATITINNNDCNEGVYDFAVAGKGATPAAALNFDGVNDYVDNGSLNALDGATTFTIEAWAMRTTSTLSYPVIFSKSSGLGAANSINIGGWDLGNPGIYARISGANDAFGYNSTDNLLPLNTWAHVAVVYNGAGATNAERLKIYVNGNLVNLTYVGTIPATAPIVAANATIGIILGNAQRWQGPLDEMRVWNVARSCEEIRQLRNCELTGSEPNLVAYYNFNQGFANENNSGVTTLTDATANGNNGTLTNFALTGATSNWVAPGAVTTGTSCAPVTSPEINVQGNSTSIADGNATSSFADHTDFAYVANGYTMTRTYTIQNTGTSAMNVTSITAVGGDAGMFSIGALTPAAPVPAGGSATFTVTYTPTGTGIKSTTLHIASNDCDEADYDFVVRGNTGPNIILDFGGIPNGAIGNYYNGGAGPNYGITFNPGIANNNGLSESSNPLVNFPAGFTTSFSVYGNVLIGFQVRVFDGLDGTGTQLGMAEYVGGPGAVVTVNFCGTGRSVSVSRYSQPNAGYDDLTFGPAPVPVPEIDVQGGSPLVTINDGDITPSTTDHTDFGNVGVNGSLARSYTIFNTGNAALTISSITSNNTRFVVSGAPTSVAANSSATFIVTFSPTALGVQNATITINNNDCNEGVYDFSVTGTGSCVAPTFTTCPTAQSANTAAGTCAAVVTYTVVASGAPAPALAYVFTGATTGSGSGNGSGSTFNKGVTNVTITATNSCGAPTCSFTVTVNDNVAPIITCQNDITVNTTSNLCTATPTLTTSMTDNCSIGNGLNFDGTNDLVTINSNSSLNSSTAFTYEGWIYVQSTSELFPTVYSRAVGDAMWLQGGGTSHIWTLSARVSGGQIDGVTTISENTWTHVALTYSAGTVRLYINGILQNTISATPQGIGLPLYLGFWVGHGRPFRGTMDEFRVWNVARTQAEITASMNTEISVQANLVAYYQFNQGVAGGNNTGINTAIDLSGNANTGALGNFALTGSGSNWVAGRFGGLTNDAPAVFPIGTTIVHWTATDASGNTATCNQNVTVVDNQIPVLTAPANQAFNVIATTCSANYTIVDPIADNCTGSTWTYTLSGATTAATSAAINDGANATNVSFNKGVTTVTLNGVDAATNVAVQKTFTVTVTDNERPTISGCVTNQSFNVITGTCAASYAIPAPTLADNCAGPLTWNAAFTGNAINPTNLTGLASGSPSGNVSFNKGTTTVTLTATDAANNTSTMTCSFVVTVVDNEKPQITCSGPVNINTTAGLCTGTTTLVAPTFTDNCPDIITTGNGIHCDGINDYLESSPLALGTNDFTIECWVKQTSLANYPVLFAQDQAGVGVPAFRMEVTNGSNTLLFVMADAGSSVVYNSTAALPLNVWTHVAVVRSGNTYTTYLNGIASGSATSVGNINQSSNAFDFRIGARRYDGLGGPGNPFEGTFDDFRVWNTARTGSQIQASMNYELLGNESGLSRYYKFNQGNAGLNNAGLTTATATIGVNATLYNFALSGSTSNWVGGTTSNFIGTTLTNNAPTMYPFGLTTVTWTATDFSGNTQTCEQTVTVVDNEAPENIVIADAISTCQFTVTPPTTTDNCAGVVTGMTNDPLTYSEAGTYVVHWTFDDGNGNTRMVNQNVIINGADVDVFGNAVEIYDGDNIPSSLDNTSMGSNMVGGSITKTFSIQNNGNQPLIISGITSDDAEFTIGTLPASPVGPGMSVTFDVTFTTLTAGLKDATINIINNSCNEQPFDFKVEAMLGCPYPEFSFIGGSTTDPTDPNNADNWLYGCIPPSNDPNVNITIMSGKTFMATGIIVGDIINNGTLKGNFTIQGNFINNGVFNPGN